ncbi:UvrD-helicase domain-containing protein [Flavobacterium sp. ARAG 55.4]|uniref:UvrD-helicase domain-containing protein n=1 Tax=Flavobacterium sp. ARAG 55.4 TaxID=3451357 RepID=UPI003F47D001
MKIEINPEHIEEAAKLLIGGNDFDDERIEFITNLDTCDLLAVPGSGKTTALLAKLYCLSKQMPFNDGSGILVLSHTNNAVDEIEKKLKKHCPHLFEYPNFVGTIQTFVNKYLANQGCFEKYGTYISKNDDEIPASKLISLTKKLPFKNDLFSYFFNQIYSSYSNLTQKEISEFLKISLKDSREIHQKLKKENILCKKGNLIYMSCKDDSLKTKNINESIKELIKSKNKFALQKVNEEKFEKATHYRLDFLSNKFINNETTFGFEKGSGKLLLEQYEILFKEGFLRYKDSFSFGEFYLKGFPKIKSILQNRFKYVFVDEMQDLEKYQIDIIENIFFKENSKTIIQRIGDPNQAIYNSTSKKVKTECDWKERKPLFLKGSNRLTKLNSNLVNRFILDSKKDEDGIPKFIVESKGEEGIKPHLIVFSHETKHLLKDKFKELINKHKLHHCEKNKENGFKIIGWSAVWDEKKEDNKNIRLQDIFPVYSKESKAKKEDFSTLSKHIQLFDENKTTLEAVRKSILNALIYILLLEEEKYTTTIRGKEVQRRYSKSEMIKHIQILQLEDKYPFAYEIFKEKLFKWCFELVTKKNYEEVFKSIKEFINEEFREWFVLSENLQPSTQLFISTFEKEVKPIKEIIREEDFSIDIATIHSVKGQTHCATMYIETFKNKYESQKSQILNVLTNSNHNFIVGEKNKGKNTGEKDAFGKEALKMMYVGFSRPTHLLCFAVLEENVKEKIQDFKDFGWEVIPI